MVIELDREKKIVMLRWLQQGFIDTQDIAEMGRTELGLPIERWIDWEREYEEIGSLADFDISQRIEAEMGMLPSVVALDTREKKVAVLLWLKRGHIDPQDMARL